MCTIPLGSGGSPQKGRNVSYNLAMSGNPNVRITCGSEQGMTVPLPSPFKVGYDLKRMLRHTPNFESIFNFLCNNSIHCQPQRQSKASVTDNQCVPIGLFLKRLGKKFCPKGSFNIWQLLGNF